MANSLTARIKRLQDHLSSQYVDFDQHNTTDRLRSLFSDFSKLKILNPYGYNANVNYWRAVILDCNLHGYLSTKDYSCFIDKNEISELFYRPGTGKPLSLNNVISDMIEITHDLLTQQEFEKRYPISIRPTSTGWLRWILTRPLRWFIPETPPHLFIVLPTVQEYAKIIVQKHYLKPLCSSLDNLFTFDEFRSAYGAITCHQETIVKLSDMDIWMILRYLNHQYGVDLADTVKTFGASATVIKFPDRNEAELVAAKITDNDKAVINLKTACSTLHRQVDELQIKSEEFLELSKEHHKNNRKPQAVYMLRKKKQVEDILDRRLKTLETMETMLLKIEASQNDLQVVQAFNLGADALRLLLDSKELNADNVDKTMENIQDTLQDQKEIEDAITVGNQDVNNAYLPDDAALEEELELLQQEDSDLNHRHHKQPQVNLTQPIDTESELLRLQNVLSSLNHPSHHYSQPKKVKELA